MSAARDSLPKGVLRDHFVQNDTRNNLCPSVVCLLNLSNTLFFPDVGVVVIAGHLPKAFMVAF